MNDERLRSYSSAFSRRVFKSIYEYGDCSHLDWLISQYDEEYLASECTYLKYISHIYSSLTREYRCEYVFKNEIINQLLLKQYGNRNTNAFNEFKAGDSIVDFALFNGESKAFEIKSPLDSPKRVKKQLDDYRKVFNKCYIVVDSQDYYYYSSQIDESVGIITLSYSGGHVFMEERRAASRCDVQDASVLIKSLKTAEYENIVRTYYGGMPTVPYYEKFKVCASMLADIPSTELNRLFIQEMKKRKTATCNLRSVPKELRQMMLSLNLPTKRQELLLNNLNKTINSTCLCITRI